MILKVAIEVGLCRSGRMRRPAWAEVRRWPGGGESEMVCAGGGGKTVPLSYQEPISCNAKSSVVMKSPPVAAFEMSQAQLLFQFLIIPFDDPAMFGHLH